MNFLENLCINKGEGSFAIERLIEQYKPLLVKESIEYGVFDDDLYQDLCLTLLNCIRKFNM